MKKILVLGTGAAQADFISFCREYGLEVHSCSYEKEGRGIAQSDFFKLIDIKDSKSIMEYARENAIDLVYSTGSELVMPTISRVSEELSLPLFNSTETTSTCQNKHLMRQAIADCSEFTVSFREVKDLDSLNGWTHFPAVVKPVDSQGQRGVTFVQKDSELRNAFERALTYSASRTVIIEELIEGFEISVNTYMIGSKPVMNLITERISFDQYPGGIIKSHRFPVKQALDKHKIDKLLRDVLGRLGIENGPAYLQIIVDKQGNPKVIEVTPRLDGCHLWRMVYHLQGIHLFKIILDHLFTGRITESEFQNKRQAGQVKAASLDFFTQKPSSLMNRELHHAANDAVYTEWYYEEGEPVSTMNGYVEKVGYQITKLS